MLDLRGALEDDFGKQLRALGIREDRVANLPERLLAREAGAKRALIPRASPV